MVPLPRKNSSMRSIDSENIIRVPVAIFQQTHAEDFSRANKTNTQSTSVIDYSERMLPKEKKKKIPKT